MNIDPRLLIIWFYLFIGIFVVFTTEILSLFKLVNRTSIIISWTIFLVLCSYFLLYFKINLFRNIILNLKKISKSKKLYIYFSLAILFLTLIIGIIYPPNTGDSHAYHLPRVMQWIQNENVSIFKTSNLQQVSFPPLSEYFLMHFHLFTNNDRLLNLIQWFSLLGCVITVSLITAQLKGNINSQILSVIFCITIPMGILQSTSTQNDLFLSLWIIITVLFIFRYFEKQTIENIFGFGISLSLAILTKPTSFIFLFPFCIWLFLFSIKDFKIENFKKLFFVLIIFIVLDGLFYYRNYNLFLNLLGYNPEATNEIINLKIFTSNLIRNISLNLTLPNVSFNEFIRQIVFNLHEMFNISATDPQSTFSSNGKYGGDYFIYFSLYETTASNTLHFCLILISIFFLPFYLKISSFEKKYLICLISGFLLFSLILKWQPWGNRLLLPFFVLFSSYIGLVFSKLKSTKYSFIFIILLIIYSLPYIFFNKTRPFLGEIFRVNNSLKYNKPFFFSLNRYELYFTEGHESFKKDFKKISHILEQSNCKRIGIFSGEGELVMEYPLWLLAKKINSEIKIFHIYVNNKTKILTNPNYNDKPCMVLQFKNDKEKEKILIKLFKNQLKSDNFKFYYALNS